MVRDHVTPPPARRVRALIHQVRSPLTAALLRVRSCAHQDGSRAMLDLEASLVAADTAVTRLFPLAGGMVPSLVFQPADLVALVTSAVRAANVSASLDAGPPLPAAWDTFAVACIVRNLLMLADAQPAHPARLTLQGEQQAAVLTLVGLAASPPLEDARRWLVQQLAVAHGGRATFAREQGRVAAYVFMLGRSQEPGVIPAEGRDSDGGEK
jgi:hypothetical protein